jgi:GntP family gluconate:H+ symporter
MFGELLASSGGAERVSSALLNVGGTRLVPWTMCAVAMILGLPLFFEAGVVLMMPIILTVGARLAKDPGGLKGNPYLLAGLPVFAGIGVLHVLVPPHPGPMVAIDALKADMGGTLLLGLVLSVPIAILSGPLFTYWVAPRASASPPVDLVARLTRTDDRFRSPGISATILTILFPILLMLGKAAVDLVLPVGHPVRVLFEFIGNPMVALLLAVLLSMFTFGFGLGKDTREVGKLLSDALPPVSAIMLIIGAGGAFKQMLIDVGLGTTIAHTSQLVNWSPLLLGWFTAVIIRLATGSATVATVTAAGLMAATVSANPELSPALLALSIGAGSMFFSHINDAGFWLVKEYMGMNLPDMFKTWSVLSTIISVAALVLIMALSLAM